MKLRGLTHVGWRSWHIVAALALAVVAVWAALPAWRDILLIASADEESSHIFLVPIVAAWMVWVRRVRLRLCPPTGGFIGPPIVAVGWAAYVYGFNHAVQSLWHAGALLVLIGCIASVLGKNVLFRMLPAFVVLIFLIPVPGTLRQKISTTNA